MSRDEVIIKSLQGELFQSRNHCEDGDERLSTGLLNLGQRVAELHRFKSNNLKLTDTNKTVLKAA